MTLHSCTNVEHDGNSTVGVSVMVQLWTIKIRLLYSPKADCSRRLIPFGFWGKIDTQKTVSRKARLPCPGRPPRHVCAFCFLSPRKSSAGFIYLRRSGWWAHFRRRCIYPKRKQLKVARKTSPARELPGQGRERVVRFRPFCKINQGQNRRRGCSLNPPPPSLGMVYPHPWLYFLLLKQCESRGCICWTPQRGKGWAIHVHDDAKKCDILCCLFLFTYFKVRHVCSLGCSLVGWKNTHGAVVPGMVDVLEYPESPCVETPYQNLSGAVLLPPRIRCWVLLSRLPLPGHV